MRRGMSDRIGKGVGKVETMLMGGKGSSGSQCGEEK